MTFTGWVNDQVIVPVLNTADVAVCPDPYNTLNDKLTMNKVMEYMALGKPIVQYDLTESRYSAGDAAVYAERNSSSNLGAKILDLLDNPEKRAEMGKLGRQRIETVLAWEHQGPVLLSAYEALGWPPGIPVAEGDGRRIIWHDGAIVHNWWNAGVQPPGLCRHEGRRFAAARPAFRLVPGPLPVLVLAPIPGSRCTLPPRRADGNSVRRFPAVRWARMGLPRTGPARMRGHRPGMGDEVVPCPKGP